MDDLDCPVTWHQGKTLDLDTEQEMRVVGGTDKPPAFWTSAGREHEDGTVQTDWTDRLVHMRKVDIDRELQGERRMFPIEPKAGSVIVRLDTAEDIVAFGRAFPAFAHNPQERDLNHARAWESVRASGQFDAIMLTHNGAKDETQQEALRLAQDTEEGGWASSASQFVRTLEFWHVSSVAWFSTTSITAGESAAQREYEVVDEGDPEKHVPRTHRLPDDASLDEGQPTLKEPKGAAAAAS